MSRAGDGRGLGPSVERCAGNGARAGPDRGPQVGRVIGHGPRPADSVTQGNGVATRPGVGPVIALTRLNGHKVVVNAELIKTVEQTPDTMLTLINGDHLLVAETVQEVVERAIEYRRQLRAFANG